MRLPLSIWRGLDNDWPLLSRRHLYPRRRRPLENPPRPRHRLWRLRHKTPISLRRYFWRRRRLFRHQLLHLLLRHRLYRLLLPRHHLHHRRLPLLLHNIHRPLVISHLHRLPRWRCPTLPSPRSHTSAPTACTAALVHKLCEHNLPIRRRWWMLLRGRCSRRRRYRRPPVMAHIVDMMMQKRLRSPRCYPCWLRHTRVHDRLRYHDPPWLLWRVAGAEAAAAVLCTPAAAVAAEAFKFVPRGLGMVVVSAALSVAGPVLGVAV